MPCTWSGGHLNSAKPSCTKCNFKLPPLMEAEEPLHLLSRVGDGCSSQHLGHPQSKPAQGLPATRPGWQKGSPTPFDLRLAITSHYRSPLGGSQEPKKPRSPSETMGICYRAEVGAAPAEPSAILHQQIPPGHHQAAIFLCLSPGLGCWGLPQGGTSPCPPVQRGVARCARAHKSHS